MSTDTPEKQHLCKQIPDPFLPGARLQPSLTVKQKLYLVDISYFGEGADDLVTATRSPPLPDFS